MAEYLERETAVMRLMQDGCSAKNVQTIMALPAVDVEKISDGYHTFADLYEQRLILSAALAKNNPHAWKSKRHEDGSVPFGGGWFIMGFDTDEGCYTYHYELNDWDLFQCKELDKGKPWDGHTSKDVSRLLSIPAAVSAPQWINVKDRLPEPDENPVIAGCEPFNAVFMAWYHSKTKRWELPSKICCEVTHWMLTSSLPRMDGAE
jgi:hypothetical protein